MKILVITPTYPPDKGGNAKSCEYWVNSVLTEGMVKLIKVKNKITLRERLNIFLLAIEYERIIIFNGWPYRKLLVPLFFFKKKIILNINNVSLICGNSTYFGEQGCKSCTIKDRISCSKKMSLFARIKFNVKEIFRSVGLKNVYGIVIYSKLFGELVKGITKNNCKLLKIDNFVHVDDNFYSKYEKSSVHNNTVSSISYVGALSHDKGIDIFTSIAEKNAEYMFSIYGFADHVKNPFKLTDTKNTQYLGGEKELCEIMSNSNILILPTRVLEGFSRVWIESACSSVPFITTKNLLTIEIFGDSDWLIKDWNDNSKIISCINKRNVIVAEQAKWLEKLKESNTKALPLLQAFIYV